ncbi:MAG: OmpA family protein, partial [Paludibacteraceae bacterium]|nr:OmpA family protein [Paludibacteraceae bacterium]
PIYDLEIRDIPTVIENGTVPAYRGSFGTIPSPNYRRSMSSFNYAGFAQVGALFQLSQRVDMSLAAFATYYINDVVSGRGSEAISFGAGLPVGEYPTPLSEERAENGLLNTNAVSSVHPWNVGLKVGFHFNTGKTEAQRAYDKEQRQLRREARLAAKLEPEPEPEIEVEVTPQVPVFVPTPVVIEPQTEDTVVEETSGCTDTIYIYIHDTIYIHDALPIVKTDAVAQITEQMEKSIIWFDLDSTVPILQPKDILINIAAILKAHPEQRVYVNGHACKLGKPDYNKRLALRRAQAVEKQLIELGVNADQLVVRTKGANEPFRFNGKHTLEKDRRVEIIPIEEEVTPVEDVKTAVAEATNVEQTTESNTNEEKVRSVVIKAGDRLSKLARQYYGDTESWRIIYDANKDVISDPDRLPVGKTIVIP